jgi:hypothetical protein
MHAQQVELICRYGVFLHQPCLWKKLISSIRWLIEPSRFVDKKETSVEPSDRPSIEKENRGSAFASQHQKVAQQTKNERIKSFSV